MVNKIYQIMLILILSSCAQWGVTPKYETGDIMKGGRGINAFIGEIISAGVSEDSDVNIVGFSVEPELFIRQDIVEYLTDAIEREGVQTEILTPVINENNASIKIEGQIVNFKYSLMVEEVPMKGEGYAYYYKSEFTLNFECIVEKEGDNVIDKTYTSRKVHATVYPYLTSWEKPFAEDLNLVVYDIVEELLEDIEKI